MLNQLLEIMNERASDAQFQPVPVEQFMVSDDQEWTDGKAPGQLGYWESEFASVLLVDLTNKSVSDVERMAKRAENYLDARILQRERKKPVVDGYLVMAVSPSEEIQGFILTIERNTLFVRKHVVVQGDSKWERCERITPIGLSRSETPLVSPPYTPDDMDAKGLLDALENMGSKDLAKLHGKEWNLNE